MDIATIATLVLEKFKNADGYSELPEKQLYSTIFRSLDMVYRKNFWLVKQKIEEDERRGLFQDKSRNDRAYLEVEDLVMDYANELAASTKEEL